MLKKIIRIYKAGMLGLAIKGEIGARLSTFGSLIGSERLIYNSWAYAIFHRAALEASPAMIQGILDLFPGIKSAVDFGCGTGVYVAGFRKRGMNADGFEYSAIARGIGRDALGLELKPFDVGTFAGAGASYDLAISFEVAEHLQPKLGDRLVEICCQHAPLVVFTAAHPGQPGQGHINMQPKPYWIEQFAKRGYRFNEERTGRLERHLRTHLFRAFWLADNLGVYERVQP